jgi:hypothetical protein
VLARLEVGDPDAEPMRIFRLTAVFAGIAALLTAGGIGRLAAYAVFEGAAAGDDLGRRRRRAILRAARAHAAASAGLVVIAAIPHGHLPQEPVGWLAFPAAGLVSGAIAGAIIGLVCSSQTALVQLSDVWSLARKPKVALQHLIDAEELARLGAALKTRTANLFDGIFEPAPPPPKPPGAGEAAREAREGGREPAAGERPATREAAAGEAPPASPRTSA